MSEFLFTNVDREGLMQGTDLNAIAEIRGATTRAVTAAGGMTTMDEVNALGAMGVDAVVGMALYTGRIEVEEVDGRMQELGRKDKVGRAEIIVGRGRTLNQQRLRPQPSAHARGCRERGGPASTKKC